MTADNPRLSYAQCRTELIKRLDEQAPTRVQLLIGPRHAGKTRLLLELKERFGRRASYAAADAHEAMVPGFWETFWAAAAERAAARTPTILLMDELHYIHDWSARIKAEFDRIRRRDLNVHIVAAGSGALNPGRGTAEMQSARFDRITLRHWSAADVAAEMEISMDAAARLIVRAGSYPAALARMTNDERFLAYVRDVILHPAIGRDMLALGVVRKPAMLRQVFMTAAMAPAQILPLQRIQRQLQDRVSIETVAQYLQLLRHGYLIAALEKFSMRSARKRAAPPKLVVLNNALCAAADPRGAPDPAAEPQRYELWVRNACLAFALNSGQRVQYWRDEQLEVDGIVDGSWGKWAIDVRTGVFTPADVRGLIAFRKRYPSFAPLILCSGKMLPVAERTGIPAQRWTEFLASGPRA
jgi:predicted AAA+ superfamily ATPase